MAYAWSRNRIGNWAIALSPILGSTITVERLKSRGVMSMQVYYQQIKPGLIEMLAINRFQVNHPVEPAGNLIREDPYAGWLLSSPKYGV
jgi:hypothetical protein